MSQSSAIGTLIRLSVTSEGRKADLGVPSALPIAELVPDLARELGVLDAGTASRGHRLLRADGHPLDMSESLAAQGIEDGAVLLLEPASMREKVYDDVVEAVADLVETRFTPWSAAHSSVTAIGAATTFFLAAAYALFASRERGLLILGLAVVATLLLLGASAVLHSVRKQLRAATALASTALVFAAVAGFTVKPTAPLWGEGMTYAGGCVVVAALLAAAFVGPHRPLFAALAVSAAVLAAIGAVTTWLGWSMTAVCAVGFVAAAILGNLLPWLGLTSSRLSTNPPRTDLEIYADVPPVDPRRVAQQVDRGHETMLAVGLATGLGMLICTPQLVASGSFGTALALVGFVGMFLRTRHARTRATVMLPMVTGVLGVAVGALAAVQTQPSWRPWVALALATAAALVVALALIVPRTRLRMGRLADALEGASLVALIPLAWFASGLG